MFLKKLVKYNNCSLDRTRHSVRAHEAKGAYLEFVAKILQMFCVSVYCNFDSRSLCGFTQDSRDNFDWTVNKGATGSTPSTGPTDDFSGNGKPENKLSCTAHDISSLYLPLC